jgi:ABC-type Co2+ transport system permease subunit
MEIETMVSGQKIEQYAMLAMPVVFVAMLKSFGEGLVDLTSGPGTAGMIIALVLFIAAFFLSRVILNIKV